MGLALIFNHHGRGGDKENIVITARSLSGGDPECFGGHPHWTLHLKLLVLGSPDQVLAHLLQGLHVPRQRQHYNCVKKGAFFTPGGEGDPDPVDWRLLLNSLSILARK